MAINDYKIIEVRCKKDIPELTSHKMRSPGSLFALVECIGCKKRKWIDNGRTKNADHEFWQYKCSQCAINAKLSTLPSGCILEVRKQKDIPEKAHLGGCPGAKWALIQCPECKTKQRWMPFARINGRSDTLKPHCKKCRMEIRHRDTINRHLQTIKQNGIDVLEVKKFQRAKSSDNFPATCVLLKCPKCNNKCWQRVNQAALKRNSYCKKCIIDAGGQLTPNWKGGRRVHKIHYRSTRIRPEDPYYCMAPKNGYVLDHRLVMAKHLGRPLGKHEIVHHLNGDRADNRIENLYLCENDNHAKEHYRVIRDRAMLRKENEVLKKKLKELQSVT